MKFGSWTYNGFKVILSSHSMNSNKLKTKQCKSKTTLINCAEEIKVKSAWIMKKTESNNLIETTSEYVGTCK